MMRENAFASGKQLPAGVQQRVAPPPPFLWGGDDFIYVGCRETNEVSGLYRCEDNCRFLIIG